LLAEMEDYLHAAKVGQHSVMEFAKSYLKGYASTWWKIMKQKEGKCHNPSLGLTTKERGCKVVG